MNLNFKHIFFKRYLYLFLLSNRKNNSLLSFSVELDYKIKDTNSLIKAQKIFTEDNQGLEDFFIISIQRLN